MPCSYSILKAELLADKMKKKKKKKRRNDPWSRSQVYMSAETIRLIHQDIGEITHDTVSLSTDRFAIFGSGRYGRWVRDARPSGHVDHGPIA